MAQSHLISFINKIQSDEGLKRKIIAAEKKASKESAAIAHRVATEREANLKAIRQIAKEAGFDIEKEIARPENLDIAPHDHEKEDLSDCCHLTCCWVETSTLLRAEDPGER